MARGALLHHADQPQLHCHFKKLRCHEIRGYYFSRPLSPQDFTTFAGENNRGGMRKEKIMMIQRINILPCLLLLQQRLRTIHPRLVIERFWCKARHT